MRKTNKVCISSGRAGFTLVELMIVVAIIGILAGIGIPSFLRYIKQSKTGEASPILRKFANGSKAYFVAEQKFSGADGPEPWHPAGPGATAPGLPIPWPSYVFPGGAATSINTAEAECTGGAADAANAPTRGEKQLPCLGVPAPRGSPQNAVINKMRLTLEDPLYFKYFYGATGSGFTAEARVSAIADFVAGGVAHTLEMEIKVRPDQEVFIGPPVLYNEFE